MNTKFYESEKIQERDNLGYTVLDGTFVVSQLQWSVPMHMATDVSKDHAAYICTPKAPKTGQRWRSELLQCYNRRKWRVQQPATGSTTSVCVAGRYFETRRVSQPVAEDETKVSLGNHSSERALTTDKLLKASSYIPNTETRKFHLLLRLLVSLLPSRLHKCCSTQSCSPFRKNANFASDLVNWGCTLKLRNHYLSCKGLSAYYLKTSDVGNTSMA
jgi:hypothetical protein